MLLNNKAVSLLTVAHISAIITFANRTKGDIGEEEESSFKAAAVDNDVMGRFYCFDQRKGKHKGERRSKNSGIVSFIFLLTSKS